MIPHELSRANQCFGWSDLGEGEGEGVRVNPNIARIVVHIGIYGRSLTMPTLFVIIADRMIVSVAYRSNKLLCHIHHEM